jgi:hypothetical protein
MAEFQSSVAVFGEREKQVNKVSIECVRMLPAWYISISHAVRIPSLLS